MASIFRVEEITSAKTSKKAEGVCSSETSLKLDGLHGVIYQKMILFITTAVKTSNPTK
jgi:hypothetical protein